MTETLIRRPGLPLSCEHFTPVRAFEIEPATADRHALMAEGDATSVLIEAENNRRAARALANLKATSRELPSCPHSRLKHRWPDSNLHQVEPAPFWVDGRSFYFWVCRPEGSVEAYHKAERERVKALATGINCRCVTAPFNDALERATEAARRLAAALGPVSDERALKLERAARDLSVSCEMSFDQALETIAAAMRAETTAGTVERYRKLLDDTLAVPAGLLHPHQAPHAITASFAQEDPE